MKIKNYIDTPYYVFFSAYFSICFVLSVAMIIFCSSIIFAFAGIFFTILISLMAYLFYIRSYNFTDNSLIIKVGFFTKEYLYKDMQKCFITENNCISFATSFKRICIELKDGTKIFISPEKMDEILFELVKKTEVKQLSKEKTPAKETETKNIKTNKIKEEKPALKNETTKKVTKKPTVEKSSTKKAISKTDSKKTTVKTSEPKKTTSKKTVTKSKTTARKTSSTKKTTTKKVETKTNGGQNK